jgi:5-formyltetrahydrofolate cyclo-ligase
MPERELDEAAEQALRARVKQELRQRMRGLRRVLPAEAGAARSRAICARLVELPEFGAAQVVVGYAAYRKEADPRAALEQAARHGKRVGLVRIGENGELCVHAFAIGDALVPNEYGIEEPLPSAARIDAAQVQLIVVPALAVDERGHRIGYGRAYYDRLLPALASAFKVAIAYDFQLLAEVPDTRGDVAVDCVVTDARTVRVAG